MNRQHRRTSLLPIVAGLNALLVGVLAANALAPGLGRSLSLPPQTSLMAGAAATSTPTARPVTPRDAFDALQLKAGFPLSAEWNPGTGIPDFLTAADPAKRLPYQPTAAERGNPVAIARGFLDENRALFKLSSVSDELKLLRIEPDAQLSYSHVRLSQTYKSLNVFGRQMVVHLDQKEQIVAVNGQFVPNINVDVRPVLNGQEAEKLAEKELMENQLTAAEAKTVKVEVRPQRTELMIYVDEAGKPTLSWRVKVLTTSPLGEWDFFVNARKPVVFHHIMFSHPAMRRMTYTARNSTNIPGRLVIDEGERSSNSIVQAAHDGAGKVYNYFWTKFKRDSIDGQGLPLVSTVNYGSDAQDAENAAWISEAQQMIYGDGGRIFKPLPYGLDVVGHEFTHGVTNSTADLVYEGQAGALNESFSDVFGALIDRGNWTIGEEVVKSPPFPTPVLRSLADPGLGGYYDPRDPLAGVGQPANMSEYANLPISRRADNGGVHINSGIPNHAAYLAAQQIGPDKLEQIYFRALTQYLTPRSNFLNTANALVRAAQDLYGTAEATAIRNAWQQVGLSIGGGQSGPTPPTDQGSPVPNAPTPSPAEQPPSIPAGCQNVVSDPGFESGSNWVQESKGAIIDTELPHSGSRSAWLGGTDQETTQYIYQDVRLPKNATTVELNYYRLIHEELTGGVLGGLFGSEPAKFSVLVANTNGDVLGTIEELSSTDGDDTWKQARFDVSELAGKSIRLAFAAENPRGNISSFFVDDVYLVTCTTGTAPTVPQTQGNTEIYLSGTVKDADTGRGVYGAQVFVLREGLSATQAAADDNVTQSEVAAVGTTDQNGVFRTDKAVKKGVTYSVIILARGYRPIVADGGLDIPSNASNPFPVDATMRKSR